MGPGRRLRAVAEYVCEFVAVPQDDHSCFTGCDAILECSSGGAIPKRSAAMHDQVTTFDSPPIGLVVAWQMNHRGTSTGTVSPVSAPTAPTDT